MSIEIKNPSLSTPISCTDHIDRETTSQGERSNIEAQQSAINHISSLFKEINDIINQFPIIDKERCTDLAEQIQNSAYSINSEKIAEKMLSFEDGLFTKKAIKEIR